MFQQLAELGVSNAPIQIAGLFAKTDYIMKARQIQQSEAVMIHDTRHMLMQMGRKSDDELQASLLHDVKAVARLVMYVLGDGSVTMPPSLVRLLPAADRVHRWAKIDEHNLRCVVTHWDDEHIYATEDVNGTELKICFSRANKYLHRTDKADWTYLTKILSEGTQLNIVRVRMEHDVCMPELIIFESDYLVNVTTIASCFEVYAESPFVNLVNKLRPQSNTQYTHLGNLSGQYLDDTVHGRDISFEESWNEFLQRNALSLICCDDLRSRENYARFVSEAKAQKRNIDKLIGDDLMHLSNIERYRHEDIILEPTFFSEVLGIQGRLDFLWETPEADISKRDTIIIEQKSGKGESVWPPNPDGDPNIPIAKEQHKVQLELYRALFVYEFEKSQRQKHQPFLLYSRYQKGLIYQGSNPDLLLRAIRLRNLITWCELTYANDGMRLLESLTAEKLRMKPISDHLWLPHIKPRLDAVLTPIHDASPLERAYFLRFMQFVEKEQMLSKIGSKASSDNGFASKWQDSLETKKASGNIYDELGIDTATLREDDKQAATWLRLLFSKAQDTDTSNFRKGDIVILYNYKKGGVPDACAQMVFRASIIDITATHIDVQLRNPQTDKRLFLKGDNMLWAIEHDLFEASTSSLYSGLQSFLSAPKERRDLILSQRMPAIDDSLIINGEYGAFNTLVTRAKQAREMFLVIGPPGTGKTSYGLLYQLREELLEPDTNILLMSFTNRAVDEICSKLVEDGIDFIRIGSELSCDSSYHSHLLSHRIRHCQRGGDVAKMITSTRVFCGTTASLNSQISLFHIKHFDLAIIDESSQILEPHLIGLLSACDRDGRCAISRFVFIGDHKQLPAVVQQTPEESAVTDEQLRSIGLTDCRLSLFERLLQQFRTADGYDPRYVYMLTKQGRMHQDIAEFPNIAFYGGKLRVVPLDHQQLPSQQADSANGIMRMITRQRVSFVAATVPGLSPASKTNSVEAEMIAAIVQQIYELRKETFDVDSTIGIIVPYRNQIATVRNAIDRYGFPLLHGITIDTVERYQGSQRDYIIYGFTIQQRYQLDFLTSNVFVEDGMLIDRKLNVAMTRARMCLIMIGNPALLSENPTFRDLISFVKQRGGYLDVPKEEFCSGEF